MQIRPLSDYNKQDYFFNDIIHAVGNQTLDSHRPAMHYHDVLEIGWVLDGCGNFLINDMITSFNKGDVSFIMPGDIHISNSIGSSDSVWNYILIDTKKLIKENPGSCSLISELFYNQSLPSHVFKSGKHRRIAGLVKRLYTEMSEKRYGYRDVALCLTTELLVEIRRYYSDKNQGFTSNSREYLSVLPAISYISAHYAENISSKQLADICYLSQTHFRRLFKEAIGTSPLDYTYQVRVAAAKALLKTKKMSVSEIALEVGYTSQTSFNKHFKRFTGKTPKEYLHQSLNG